jgi:hypothetical protein
MKKIILLMAIISFSSYSGNIENIVNDKNKLNKATDVLCKKINIDVIEDHEKMACLSILKEGFNINNFYSYYVFYNALNSKVNFSQDLSLNAIYNKMEKIKKTKEEENLFSIIK